MSFVDSIFPRITLDPNWRLGGLETRRLEAWRLGGLEAWRIGGAGAWRGLIGLIAWFIGWLVGWLVDWLADFSDCLLD